MVCWRAVRKTSAGARSHTASSAWLLHARLRTTSRAGWQRQRRLAGGGRIGRINGAAGASVGRTTPEMWRSKPSAVKSSSRSARRLSSVLGSPMPASWW